MLLLTLSTVAIIHAGVCIALSLLTGWDNQSAISACFTVSAVAVAYALNARWLNRRARAGSSQNASLLNRLFPPLAVGVSVYTLVDIFWNVRQGNLLETVISLVVILAAAVMLVVGVNAVSE